MIPYKTSKDYKRLKELLDEGKEIVCLYKDPFDGKTKCANGKADCSKYHLYGFIHNRSGDELKDLCEIYNVEFIEPNL